MKLAGDMWILDDDKHFQKEFRVSGDQFDAGSLKMAVKHIDKTRVAIDGGAHYGSWTRTFAGIFDQVIAFEPRNILFECLEANTEYFDNVERIQKALGHEERNVDIANSKEVNSGTWSIRARKTKNEPHFAKGKIPLITIDSLNLDVLDFLKLDVEGFELYALQGAEETLLRCKPIIHLEDKGHSTSYGINRGAPRKYLEELGAIHLESYKRRDHVFGWDNE